MTDSDDAVTIDLVTGGGGFFILRTMGGSPLTKLSLVIPAFFIIDRIFDIWSFSNFSLYSGSAFTGSSLCPAKSSILFNSLSVLVYSLFRFSIVAFLASSPIS